MPRVSREKAPLGEHKDKQLNDTEFQATTINLRVENIEKVVLIGSPWPNVHLENGIMGSIQLRTISLSTVYILVILWGAGNIKKKKMHAPPPTPLTPKKWQAQDYPTTNSSFQFEGPLCRNSTRLGFQVSRWDQERFPPRDNND